MRIGEALVARRGPGAVEKTGRSGRLRFVEERTELYDAAGDLVQVMCWVDVHAKRSHVALTNAQRATPDAPAMPGGSACAGGHRRRRRRPRRPRRRRRRRRRARRPRGTQFVMYAGASGDFHPLHHDEDLARGPRLPVWCSRRACSRWRSRVARCYYGRRRARRLRKFAAGSALPEVWPGDTLSARVRVGDGRVEVVTAKHDGTVVFDGYATVGPAAAC